MKKKQPESEQLKFSYSQERIRKLITQISSSIQSSFRRSKPLVILFTYPKCKDYPVFTKKIVMGKSQTADDAPINELDIPDFVDLVETTLPWTGMATFKTGSRQFRNKNVLMANVEVILEFDQELYILRDEQVYNAVRTFQLPHIPVIFARQTTSNDPDWGVTITQLPHTPEEASAVCDVTRPLSGTIMEFMAENDYTYNADSGLFESSYRDDTGMLVTHRIVAQRYGSVIDVRLPA